MRPNPILKMQPKDPAQNERTSQEKLSKASSQELVTYLKEYTELQKSGKSHHDYSDAISQTVIAELKKRGLTPDGLVISEKATTSPSVIDSKATLLSPKNILIGVLFLAVGYLIIKK